MFKFLPLLIFAFASAIFAEGHGHSAKNRCAQWCATHFPLVKEICEVVSAKGEGSCYDCGPMGTNRDRKLCDGRCRDITSDDANCGKCGKSCPLKTHCVKKSCICENSNEPQCKGQCPDYNSDPANCGTCGNVCPSGQCMKGVCAVPSCTAQRCDTYMPWGPGSSFVCASVVGGGSAGFCYDGDTPCSDLAGCSTTADCAAGEVCSTSSCCQRNTCISADACGSTSRKASLGKVTGLTFGRGVDYR